MPHNGRSEGNGVAMLLGLVTIVPLALWGGFVLETLWNWFIPTIFVNAPALNIAEAIGLSLVVSYLTSRRLTATAKDESALEAITGDIVYALVTGGVMLLMGFIVHGFL